MPQIGSANVACSRTSATIFCRATGSFDVIVTSTPSAVGVAIVFAVGTALGQLRMRFGTVPLSCGSSAFGCLRVSSERSVWQAATTSNDMTQANLMHTQPCDSRASAQISELAQKRFLAARLD